MEISDRPHRTNSGSSSSSTSELFICFTSRLSSSSMKLSSKSILSPGRAREPSHISLSNSLSRRLRSNGSMKGGQASPMFPTNGKKRECAFENPEPSSPKVTCIGQVRVKTKKQSKKLRTRSKGRGEISFRRVEQNSNNNDSNNVDQGSSVQDYSLANHHHQQQQQQREDLPHRNQRWVHLSLTICEALKAFGAEFNCFLPCRSSCLTNGREKEEKTTGSGHGSSCGAVFARWLVTMQEGEGKGKEIELVVGEEKQNEGSDDGRRRSYRRHVFEEIEFIDEKFGAGNEGKEQEEARVSICIPPKNALLLMKCRSDPVKIAALANKLWEAPIPQEEDEEENEEEKIEVAHASAKFWEPALLEYGDDREGTGNVEGEKDMEHNEENLMEEKTVALEAVEEQQIEDSEACAVHLEANEDGGDTDTGDMQGDTSTIAKQENEMGIEVMNQADATQVTTVLYYGSSHEEMIDARKSSDSLHENEVEQLLQENEDVLEGEGEGGGGGGEEAAEDFGGDSIEDTTGSLITAKGQEEGREEVAGKRLQQDQEPEAEGAGPPTEVELLAIKEESEEDNETAEENSLVVGVEEEAEGAEKVTHQGSESEDPKTQGCPAVAGPKSNKKASQTLLPDCLLLMMCEPKLSMEVSKETWVCGTDFIRWLPEHSRPPAVNKRNGQDETKQRRSIDLKAAANLQQPPRSSCSYPAKPPARRTGTETMSTMIEQKLAGTKNKVCEPLVLTRCKSEPMRSAAKLAPEACFWKNRKLEPHRSATLGVGAAGVGF